MKGVDQGLKQRGDQIDILASAMVVKYIDEANLT